MKKKYKYIFGPVPSRRFGRSLGIDLLPYKTCSLDCVFCQLGRTPKKEFTRRGYAPIDDVLSEIKEWLDTDGEADCLTLAGSGEPTLHSDFGRILDFLSETDILAVLLTNGTLLHLPEVREQAAKADIVKASLSAWDQHSFERINRPHDQLKFDQFLRGLKDFRNQYKGKFWLEVFLVPGINSEFDDVKKIAALAKEIGPEKVQLNTAVRPPAEEFVAPVQKQSLETLTHLFKPAADIIAEFSSKQIKSPSISLESILAMLHRRPCTANQIACVYGIHINEVSKILGELVKNNSIHIYRKDNDIYYTAAAGSE